MSHGQGCHISIDNSTIRCDRVYIRDQSEDLKPFLGRQLNIAPGVGQRVWFLVTVGRLLHHVVDQCLNALNLNNVRFQLEV